MIAEASIKARYEALRPWLDERARRLLAAAESQALGPRGISAVSRATGVSRRVIRQGMAELKEPTALVPGAHSAGRWRQKEGGGSGPFLQDGSGATAGVHHARRPRGSLGVDL